MQYGEVLKFLYEQLPMYQKQGSSAFKKDLTNIIALCEYLGNPQKKFKSIHIAGTNGKGSSAHLTASILQESGYKTGLYTSPHLKSFTERIKINGKEVTESFVVGFVENIKTQIDVVQPSFFEITVAMAFQYFASEKVDVAVIEVGLGGRLDSTNIIDPVVGLITNISFDHEKMLGDTLPKIAGEKAGIIKKNTPIVIGQYQSEVAEVFNHKATQLNAQIIYAEKALSKSQVSFIKQLRGFTDYQKRNIPGVMEVVNILNQSGFKINQSDLETGIREFKLNTGFRGRWDILQEDPIIIADVGHNEAGIKNILSELSKFDYERLIVVWGMVNDKDIQKIISLLPKEALYILVEPDIPRAMKVKDMLNSFREVGLHSKVSSDVNAGIRLALEVAESDDLIFVGGSTFVVAEISESFYQN